MKFSEYLFSPRIRFRSVLYGVLLGGAVMLFWGNIQYALLAGAVATLILSFLFPLSEFLSDRPYFRVMQRLSQPFLVDRRVHFSIRGGGVVKGFFLLTDRSMIFLANQNTMFQMDLSREDVHYVSMSEDGATFSVFLNDKQFIRVVSVESEEIFRILCENGWKARY